MIGFVYKDLAMISETRQIVFSNRDLIRAIVDFDRNHKKRLPKHKILECKLRSEPTVATLVFDTAWLQEQTLELDAASLAAALIYACSVRRIPLPRNADKVLQPVGDSLAINFTITNQGSESDFEENSRRWDLENEPIYVN